MTSIVVHNRLDTKALYICIQAVKAKGFNTDKMPLSTILRIYIEGTALSYQKSFNLPIPDNVDDLVISKVKRNEITEIDFIDISSDGKGGGSIDEGQEGDIRRTLSEILHNDPSVDEPLFNTSQVDEKIKLPPPPWEVDHTLSLASIELISPKDAILVGLDIDDPIQVHSLEVTYTTLHQDKWGTPEAMKRMAEMMKIVEKYFQ